jgi:hypothetical protein
MKIESFFLAAATSTSHQRWRERGASVYLASSVVPPDPASW